MMVVEERVQFFIFSNNSILKFEFRVEFKFLGWTFRLSKYKIQNLKDSRFAFCNNSYHSIVAYKNSRMQCSPFFGLMVVVASIFTKY